MITEEKRAAILKVIEQIDRYRGGVIVRGRHPLWKAIVALEALSRTGFKLDMPASSQWYHGLWASRAGSPNVPIGTRVFNRRKHSKHRNPKLAVAWMAILKATLEKWLAADSTDRSVVSES